MFHEYFTFPNSIRTLNESDINLNMWQLLTVVVLLLNALSGSCRLSLTITPNDKEIILEENADLNLTCRVLTKDKIKTKFDLSWKLPSRFNSPFKSNLNGDRVTVDQARDELTVTVHNLQEDDTGVYMCKLQDKGLIWTRKIFVEVKSRKCMKPFFDCGNGRCISKHYVCDGRQDCPNGDDEDYKHCGPDACQGKILCDGRCISKELCCDPTFDTNCTVGYLMPCCHNILHPREANSALCPPSDQRCSALDLFGFKNSFIYVSVFCAGVLIVCYIVFAKMACRECEAKMTAEEVYQLTTRVPHEEVARQSSHEVAALRHESDSPDNIDFLLEDVYSDGYHGNSGSDTPDDFVLCSFVPGAGYQVIPEDPKPPPYTEYAIGIPPPPYESVSNIPEELKNTDTEADSLPPPPNYREFM